MKNIIVTGGAGFIGSNLIDRMMSRGDKVLCVDNLSTGNYDNVRQYEGNDNFRFFNFDITTLMNYYGRLEFINEVKSFFNDTVDEIYNFACPASPKKYQLDPIHTLNCSVAVSELCKFALLHNSILLQSSTSEIYGEPAVSPQPETYRGYVNTIGPRSCYDEGKRVAETYVREYYNIGCKCKMIRIFNTYGPKMDPNDGRVVSNFICQALRNEPITIYGDGKQSRSFQYIDDLLDGIEKVMDTPDDEFRVFNIGNPVEFDIIELADMILRKITESKSQIVYENLPNDDPTHRKPDITQAKEILGWCPRIMIDDGLDKTIEYFRELLKR